MTDALGWWSTASTSDSSIPVLILGAGTAGSPWTRCFARSIAVCQRLLAGTCPSRPVTVDMTPQDLGLFRHRHKQQPSSKRSTHASDTFAASPWVFRKPNQHPASLRPLRVTPQPDQRTLKPEEPVCVFRISFSVVAELTRAKRWSTDRDQLAGLDPTGMNHTENLGIGGFCPGAVWIVKKTTTEEQCGTVAD